MKNFFKKGENVFSLLLLVSFFLPWVDMGIASLPGYKVVSVGQGLTDLAKTFGNNDFSTTYLYSLYLIPFLALLIMYMSYKGETPKLLSITTGSLIIFGFIVFLLSGGGFAYLGIGVYLTLLSGFGLILSALNIVDFEKKGGN